MDGQKVANQFAKGFQFKWLEREKQSEVTTDPCMQVCIASCMKAKPEDFTSSYWSDDTYTHFKKKKTVK